MKKALKITLVSVAVLILVVLAALLTIPLWFGPVVKPVANSMVPKYTLTGFDLGHVYLNPFTGRFELGAVRVENPKGYKEPVALSLSNLTVDVAVSTICSDTFHIEEITVENLFVSYVQGGGNGVDNFTQIQYNIAGGKENYERNQAASKTEEPAVECEDGVCSLPQDDSDGKPGRKFVIDRLSISGIKLKYGAMVIPLPELTLTGLGKDSGGITAAEVLAQIGNAIITKAMDFGRGLTDMLGASADKAVKAASVLGDQAKDTVSGVGTKAKETFSGIESKTKETVSGFGEDARSAASSVGAGAKNAAETVGSGAVKAATAVGSGAVKAATAVGGGAVKAVETVGGGAVKAVESVGEGTKNAAKAIKDMFK